MNNALLLFIQFHIFIMQLKKYINKNYILKHYKIKIYVYAKNIFTLIKTHHKMQKNQQTIQPYKNNGYMVNKIYQKWNILVKTLFRKKC